MKTRYSKTVLGGAIAVVMCAGLSPPAYAVPVNYERIHTFTMDDVQGAFTGSTYGDAGLVQDSTIICMSGCDNIYDDTKSGVTMYPVDSEFGFIVEDFVRAAPKTHDAGLPAALPDDIPYNSNLDYLEGHVGNIPEDGTGTIIGVAVSNAKTAKFKVKYPQGTWCAGLGSNSVKCETEHYSVLEHVLTCNETLPYWYYDFVNDKQADLIDPGTGEVLGTCANGALNDTLYHIVNGIVTETPVAPDLDDPTVPNLETNEASVMNNIAVGPDYGMSKKDDGKALYRFGNFVKKPNDIRLYAKIELPEVWKNPEAGYEESGYTVTSAKLIVQHLITNNPNDQIRPEDMENEGAIGRKPDYTVDGGGNWVSDRTCYEGDGDELPAGYILMNAGAAMGTPDGTVPTDGTPYPYSSDLVGGFTNGWYTTTDRDPFANVDSDDIDLTSSAIDPGDVLNGGPRWRLIANKFGQDLPGLEIPDVSCSPVPYSSANIRYPVGNYTETTINLLDWVPTAEQPDSPLANSKGWVNAAENVKNFTKYVDSTSWATDAPNGVSINGAPLTDDFDLVVYIKGDRKATAVYNAKLDIEYEGGEEPPVDTYDLAVVGMNFPATVQSGDTVPISATIANNGTTLNGGTVTIVGYDVSNTGWQIVAWLNLEVTGLAAGTQTTIGGDWIANSISPPDYVVWYTFLAPDTDDVPDNDVWADPGFTYVTPAP